MKDSEIDEHIEEAISRDNIPEIFYSYIIKNKIKGIDNIDNDSFLKKITLHANHISSTIRDYHYSPYLEKLISKGRNKRPRVISIPTIKDRIVLYILKELLHQIFPECINNELVNIRIRSLHKFLLESHSEFIIKMDIKGFYDSINQNILLEKIKMKTESSLFLSLIENAIINPTVPKNHSKKDRSSFSQYSGIPQGLSISNILANIYLYDFDQTIKPNCDYYYRYVDDIFLICPADKKDNVYASIKNMLQRLNLEINTDKTEIIKIDDNFNFTFLGYKLDSTKISIRSTSIQNHINAIFSMLIYCNEKLARKTLWEEGLTEDLLVNRIESELNEKITGAISENKKYGWLFYFSAMNDLSILYKMNLIIRSAVNRVLPSNISKRIVLKNYIKAYHEIRRNPKSQYIHNYDIYVTVREKMDYLDFRGYLDNKRPYSEEEIEYLFSIVREKNLASMQRDLGSLS
jgi:retron-type reverse transcriptase